MNDIFLSVDMFRLVGFERSEDRSLSPRANPSSLFNQMNLPDPQFEKSIQEKAAAGVRRPDCPWRARLAARFDLIDFASWPSAAGLRVKWK
jgi:hypothetical protein